MYSLAQREEMMNVSRGYFHTSPEDVMRSFAQEHEIEIPYTNAICDECHGDGTRALHGMVISGEALEDQDFMEDYFEGKYDTKCEACNGRGLVREPNLDRLQPELRKQLEESLQEARYANAESLAERRMGA